MEEELKIKIKIIRDWLATGSINIFGLPFSGKDTHGAELASFLEGPLIGGGDILRSGSSTPQHVIDEINKGHLAPTEEYRQIVVPYLIQEEYDGKPLVLSSVGRWIGEEKSVIDACQNSNHPLKAAIFLHIPESETRKRWQNNKRERHDDASSEILEKRLEEFRTKTIPVLDVYKSQNLLITINALPSIPVVTASIIDRLHEFATK